MQLGPVYWLGFDMRWAHTALRRGAACKQSVQIPCSVVRIPWCAHLCCTCSIFVAAVVRHVPVDAPTDFIFPQGATNARLS